MHIEAFREYCLNKKGTTEGFPFDHKVLVFKVQGKMFALTDVNEFQSINLKCNPELALELRAQYPAVQPGYHMNKKHWNTIEMDGSVPDDKIRHWINHSYELVVAGLPKKLRLALKEE